MHNQPLDDASRQPSDAPITLPPAEPVQSAPDRIAPSIPFSRKIGVTLACLSAFLLIPYAHPSLSALRLLEPKATSLSAASVPPLELPPQVVGEVQLPGETVDQQQRADELEARPIDARGPLAQAPSPQPQPSSEVKLVASDEDAAPPDWQQIQDPSGHALDTFFAKLSRVERKEQGAFARILYYGDSIVGSDLVTGKMRRLLQSRFGDAGHGYAHLANAWPGWFHLDVSREASANWKVSRVLGPFAKDGFYGLAGVSFRAEEPDAWARFATADRDVWGRNVSRFDIEYLAQPGGGDIAVIVDKVQTGVFTTNADTVHLATHSIKLEDGPHSLEIRTVDTRPVRAFGIRMEREVPGVVLTALGLTGGRVRFLDKWDTAHWTEALRQEKPDLVCLAFGSNEVADGMRYPLADYEATMRTVMQKVRAALPTASLMLVGHPDVATAAEGTKHSRPTVRVLANIQRKVAAEEGWAFFDQFVAMGGAGSLWSWVKMGMGNPDLFHPTGSGGNQLGTWQYKALMYAYKQYKERLGAADGRP